MNTSTSRNAHAETRVSRRRIDFGSLAALPLGIGIVFLAQLLEGGAAASLLHGPAALIVFGGTLAALLITYSPAEVMTAVRTAARTFLLSRRPATDLSSVFVGFAIRAQHRGLVVLDEDIEDIDDPFLRHGLSLVVDGVAIAELKDVLAAARSAGEDDEDGPIRVFEAAAGYAPTLGILGAVLGLIQVMQHLGQPGVLGSGIAAAFVATLYGVGAANLLFLPIASRLREEAVAAGRRRELMTEGLLALHQRVSPRVLAHRLRAFAPEMPRIGQIAARMAAKASANARADEQAPA